MTDPMRESKLLIVAALAAAAFLMPAFGAPVDAFNVAWDSPSANHHGSMPLGNGDITLNAWMTKDGDLHFYIGKTDAWDDNARLLKVGKVRVHFEPNPIVAGQTFRQELKLREGCIEIAAGNAAETKIRLWVDANHPVVHDDGGEREAGRSDSLCRTLADESVRAGRSASQRCHERNRQAAEQACPDDPRTGHAAHRSARSHRLVSPQHQIGWAGDARAGPGADRFPAARPVAAPDLWGGGNCRQGRTARRPPPALAARQFAPVQRLRAHAASRDARAMAGRHGRNHPPRRGAGIRQAPPGPQRLVE